MMRLRLTQEDIKWIREMLCLPPNPFSVDDDNWYDYVLKEDK